MRVVDVAVRRVEAGWRYEARLIPRVGEPFGLWFEFSGPEGEPRLSARPAVLAALPVVMRLREPLEVELPLDDLSIRQLHEWQQAFAVWMPDRLQIAEISAPRGAVERGLESALQALSGGVDSCYTLMQLTQSPPAGFAPLRAALMVHGFDIPLDQPEVFAGALQRTRAIADAHGIAVYPLRTNVRELGRRFDTQWDLTDHGAWLAAALACYERWFGVAVVPSTYAYRIMRFPWGSNPITDPMLSSQGQEVVHLGAEADKLQKVMVIAHDPAVARHLRVCWKGQHLDRNCGRCFKCLATHACMNIAGVERPGCFEGPLDLEALGRLAIVDTQARWLVSRMREQAHTAGLSRIEAALALAERRARRAGMVLWLRQMGTRIRRFGRRA